MFSSFDMKTTILIAVAISALAFVPACSDFGTSQTYTTSELGSLEVQYGKIMGLEKIIINPEDRDYGTLIGAAAGAGAGSLLGGGSGKTLSTIGGGLLGAFAGNQIDKGVSQVEGYEVSVRLDNGKDMVIRQKRDKNIGLYEGQRVKVMIGNTPRVVPIN